MPVGSLDRRRHRGQHERGEPQYEHEDEHEDEHEEVPHCGLQKNPQMHLQMHKGTTTQRRRDNDRAKLRMHFGLNGNNR